MKSYMVAEKSSLDNAEEGVSLGGVSEDFSRGATA